MAVTDITSMSSWARFGRSSVVVAVAQTLALLLAAEVATRRTEAAGVAVAHATTMPRQSVELVATVVTGLFTSQPYKAKPCGR
jgi:hypothetical protein